ncbi:MAG: hypothetical protein F4078_03365, partial [Acidimicrobiia bacterium]|nr:hypothetical protein [Acidimicrobiia bacterium]
MSLQGYYLYSSPHPVPLKADRGFGDAFSIRPPRRLMALRRLSRYVAAQRPRGVPMKSPPFAYHRAASAAEAAALLAEFGADARILAGGQSLIPLMNLRLASPGCLVDITTAADLDGCGSNGGGLDVGAAARQRSVELHADTLATAPALAEAIANAGQVPVRHQGTVVGSIAHADPSAEMPAAFKAQGGTVRVLDASGSREIA